MPLLLLFLLPLSPAFPADPLPALRILDSRCLSCHSKSIAMSGLDLSSRPSTLKGGSRGPSLVPGDPNASLLIQAVQRSGKLAMPPTAPLDAKEREILQAWVAAGAAWPDQVSTSSGWWSFQKLQAPPTPPSNAPWINNPIDAFILAKQQSKGLHPAPEASRAVLIRRLYFDLTGLPPTPAQVSAFLADTSDLAYAKLVEQLLASPRYGEKWGRHWLDLVRYSDTAGFELDSYIADAWRYRDWVIDSFNSDKPYDRFIREQLAGDEFFPEDPIAQTGTGYFCVGPNRDLFPDQADINRVETLTDYVDTTAAVFLGLTAGCARCHDHKYDPIPQRDYFRLQAVFAPGFKTKVALNRLTSLGWDVAENWREIKFREIGETIAAIQKRCRDSLTGDKSDEKIRACLSPPEKARLTEVEKELVSLFAGYRAKPFACGFTDAGDFSPKTFIPGKDGEVHPGFLTALGGGDISETSFQRPTTGPIPLTPTTGRRKALADWIAGPANPLTARVLVNRVWQYHFGRGIVATPSNLGTRGNPPTHPELLDWLALRFIDQGWSIKNLHRLILHSATYKQSAAASPEAQQQNPDNSWLSHFSRRRLDAEELRDAVLAATGTLNGKMGGRPVVPPLTSEELFNLIGRPEQMWIVTGDQSEHLRRSIYLFQKRTFRLPMMEVFDSPESMLTCSRRDVSTTAPQSLTWLNGDFINKQAQAMAQQSTSVQEIWSRLLLRQPTPVELSEAEKFLAAQTTQTGTRRTALTELVRALLNTNEFLYVD